jgi:hypothetical protein
MEIRCDFVPNLTGMLIADKLNSFHVLLAELFLYSRMAGLDMFMRKADGSGFLSPVFYGDLS